MNLGSLNTSSIATSYSANVSGDMFSAIDTFDCFMCGFWGAKVNLWSIMHYYSTKKY